MIPVSSSRWWGTVYIAHVIFAGVLFLGCRTSQISRAAGFEDTGFIEVDGFGFRNSTTGTPWVPVGVNYDHDAEGRLIEDYWHEEWMRVVGDFKEMADLGFTVVRIHLQFGKFMKSPTTLHESQLKQLDKVIALAERLGLRLDITGLAHYRKEDIPEWFLLQTDAQMIETERMFWSTIATRYAQEPAIFCYDLQNEPIVNLTNTDEIVGPPFIGVEGTYHFINLKGRDVSTPWTEWIQSKYGTEKALGAAWLDFPRKGETFDSIQMPGALDKQRAKDLVEFGHDRARTWTRRMVEAIREKDHRHLITIGLLPDSLPFGDFYASFPPQALVDLLDFISVHIHLRESEDSDNSLESEMILRAAYVGKPVLMEEFSMLIQPERASRFLERSRSSVSGYLGYYWGDLPKELRAKGTLREGITADHIEMMGELSLELQTFGVKRVGGSDVYNGSINALRLKSRARKEAKEWFSKHTQAERFVDFQLTL